MPQPMGPATAPTTRIRRSLAAALAALTLLSAATAAMPPASLAYGGDGLRAAVNKLRADARVAPVVGTALLDDIASHRASQLVRIDRMEHDIDYVTSRLNQAGVCWKGVGEILAWERNWGDYDYDRTALAWKRSDDHREIMLGAAYNAAGGAWRAAHDHQYYSVMVFVVLCGGGSTSQENVTYLKPTRHYNPDRQMVLSRGKHTGYRLAEDGTVLARKTVSFGHRVFRTSSGRARADGTRWLKVSSGELRGFWVRESPRQFVRGRTELVSYAEPHPAVVDAGRYRGYDFNWMGTPVRWRSQQFWQRKTHYVTDRAIINGRWYDQFESGWPAGYWILDTNAIDLL